MACLSWKTVSYKAWLLTGTCFYLLSGNITWSQIIPDTTLANNTVVIPNGKHSTIGQGTEVGNNLFDSFISFSVSAVDVAFFNNERGIQNMISRVTGGNLGLLNKE